MIFVFLHLIKVPDKSFLKEKLDSMALTAQHVLCQAFHRFFLLVYFV